jgi:hypothetical protein
MSLEFKFKSDHEFERVELEGKSGLTASELRQVVTDRRLNGSAGAFGLKLSNAQTGEGHACPLPDPHCPLPTAIPCRCRIRRRRPCRRWDLGPHSPRAPQLGLSPELLF